jgi:hypothetical protein
LPRSGWMSVMEAPARMVGQWDGGTAAWPGMQCRAVRSQLMCLMYATQHRHTQQQVAKKEHCATTRRLAAVGEP